ncbi:MAG: hypothetical protein ACYCYM_10915 [Saccharofermentanales bacterium]
MIKYITRLIHMFNGDSRECTPGGYVSITQAFKDGDEILLDFDMRGRIVTSPGSVNHKAVLCGPIVLAFDNRIVLRSFDRLWINDADFRKKHDENWKLDYYLINQTSACKDVKYIDIDPAEEDNEDAWIIYEVPFISRPSHFFNHKHIKVKMCDYASAGSQFSAENIFRVWIPQPALMSNIFPHDTEKNNTHSLKD